ncbi:hypothetical protein H2203_008277 [Taxawa tesnikishii (nom. ined.)]|nr:hypothetical protein H2203_008277 [Dothideales sp. JES 119]
MLASKWDGPQNVNFSNHQKARHKMACDKTAGLITAQTFSGRPELNEDDANEELLLLTLELLELLELLLLLRESNTVVVVVTVVGMDTELSDEDRLELSEEETLELLDEEPLELSEEETLELLDEL